MQLREKVFQDRKDAGRVLALTIQASEISCDCQDGIALGLPRGGVPVTYEVAHTLGLPLDIFIVRQLEVPGSEELAMGTVASDGTVAMNSAIIQELRISEEAIRAEVERAKLEIKRQENTYRNGRPPDRIDGRMAILVDDGLAERSGYAARCAGSAAQGAQGDCCGARQPQQIARATNSVTKWTNLFAREYRGRSPPCGPSFGISSRLQMKMSALCCQRPATIRKHCGQLKGASVLMARSRVGSQSNCLTI